jgi:hypothetical protein
MNAVRGLRQRSIAKGSSQVDVTERVPAPRTVIVDEDHLAARSRYADGFRDGLAADVFRLFVQQEEHHRLVEPGAAKRQRAGILVVV